jgi:hypothetical protein
MPPGHPKVRLVASPTPRPRPNVRRPRMPPGLACPPAAHAPSRLLRGQTRSTKKDLLIPWLKAVPFDAPQLSGRRGPELRQASRLLEATRSRPLGAPRDRNRTIRVTRSTIRVTLTRSTIRVTSLLSSRSSSLLCGLDISRFRPAVKPPSSVCGAPGSAAARGPQRAPCP